MTFCLLIRTQNRGAVQESLNMSGLQSLCILTLVLFAVVVAVDAGSNIPWALLSIGNLHLRQINCTGLYWGCLSKVFF